MKEVSMGMNVIKDKNIKSNMNASKKSNKEFKKVFETTNNKNKEQTIKRKNKKSSNHSIKEKNKNKITNNINKNKSTDDKHIKEIVTNNEEDSLITENILFDLNNLLKDINDVLEKSELDKVNNNDIKKLSGLVQKLSQIAKIMNKQNHEITLDNSSIAKKQQIFSNIDKLKGDILEKELNNLISSKQIESSLDVELSKLQKQFSKDLEDLNTSLSKIHNLFESMSNKNKAINLAKENENIRKNNNIKSKIELTDTKENSNNFNFNKENKKNVDKLSGKILKTSEVRSSNIIENIETKVSDLDQIKNKEVIEVKNKPFALDKNDVISQIKDRLIIKVNNDNHQAKITLKPKELGDVTIRLLMKDGNLLGKISVENHEIKNLLDNNLNQLKDNLVSKGVNVEGFSVSVGQDSNFSNNNSFFNQGRQSSDLNLEEIEKSEENEFLLIDSYEEISNTDGTLDIKA